MSDNLPFDEFVKDQFADYSPNVPAHILENIMAKRKTKPKGFWIKILSAGNIFFIALLITAGVGGYYLLATKNNFTSANNKNNIAISFKNKNLKENKADSAEQIFSGDKKIKSGNTSEVDKTADGEESAGNSLTGNSVLSFSDKYKIKKYRFVNTNTENVLSNNVISTSENSNPQNKLLSPFTINNVREMQGLQTLVFKNLKLPDCPTIEKNAAGNKQYWDVYAGPDKAFEVFKTYTDTGSNNYLQKRKASTKFASAFSAGIRYTKVFDNGVSARAGLNYSQVNEKFLFFNPSELKYVTVITTRVIIRQPGDTVYINDTLQYQQSGTRTKVTYNRYRNIDIPLVLGYEIGNGKIHANINAGVIINIYSWYKGDVLDSLYQPVSITTGKGNSVYQFKNNIGIGFLGGVSFYYKITDRLHLLLEPYFRYNLSPMSNKNLNLQEKYNTAGVRTGVRFDLK